MALIKNENEDKLNKTNTKNAYDETFTIVYANKKTFETLIT